MFRGMVDLGTRGIKGTTWDAIRVIRDDSRSRLKSHMMEREGEQCHIHLKLCYSKPSSNGEAHSSSFLVPHGRNCFYKISPQFPIFLCFRFYLKVRNSQPCRRVRLSDTFSFVTCGRGMGVAWRVHIYHICSCP